jgi:hypothetical protein
MTSKSRFIRELSWLAACVVLSSLTVAAFGVSDFNGPGEAIPWLTILLYVIVLMARLFFFLLR